MLIKAIYIPHRTGKSNKINLKMKINKDQRHTHTHTKTVHVGSNNIPLFHKRPKSDNKSSRPTTIFEY